MNINTRPTHSSHDPLSRIGEWINQRRRLLGSAAVVALGLALGWNWLAAAGVLPILVAMLPCALMMGMCMRGSKSSTDASATASSNAPTANSGGP